MTRKPLALAAIGALFAAAAVLAPPHAAIAAAAETDVVINEIITNDAVLADSIELYNRGTEPVDVSGWVIKDNDDTRTDALPAGTVIDGGAYLVLVNKTHFNFGLGNGDAARIYNATGTEIDAHTFPSHSNPSWSRCPNGTGEFIQAPSVTLGAANDCAVTPATADDLVLNEVDSGPLDWVELYNKGTQPLNISGYIMTDNAPSDPTHRYVFPDGTVIGAQNYLVVEQTPDTFGFGLGGADSVLIFAPGTTDFVEANAIQSASWTAHAAIGGDEAIAANSRCANVTGTDWVVTYATPGAFNDCPGGIRINEVESNGDATDWVEIVNASTAPIDISGWTLTDDDPAGSSLENTPVPGGTVLAPGAYFVFDQGTHFSFGLGKADMASVRDASGTVVAEYAWAEHAAVTYGRCPDTTGPMGNQPVSTKGAVNNCDGSTPEIPEPETPIVAQPWPGSPDVTVQDQTQMFLGDFSGLDFQESADGTFLWGVDNDAATVFKLIANADGSVEFAPGWEGGKKVVFQTNTGPAGPDAEGITIAGDGFVYLAIERDNNFKGVNLNKVLKVDPNVAGAVITAAQEWDLTATLPAVAANTGLEAIEWVADDALAGKLWDATRSKPYDPADYPGHGDGLFLVAVENNGHVYAFALNADGTHSLVGETVPFLGGVMALDWDAELGLLWAACDNGCEGTAAQVTFNGTATPDVAHVQRPANLPNLNNEGLATSTNALCVNGARPVWWAADGEVPAALRSGSLPCTVVVPPVDPEPQPPVDPAPQTGGTTAQQPAPQQTAATNGGKPLPATGVASVAVLLTAALGAVGGAAALGRRCR